MTRPWGYQITIAPDWLVWTARLQRLSEKVDALSKAFASMGK